MTLFDWEWPLDQAKAVLIDHLKTLGYAKVTIGYDGIDDEGGLTEIEAIDTAGATTPIPLFGERDEATKLLANALESFAWRVLDDFHHGYEINDGAFGLLTIDVTASKVSLDKNDRFTSYHSVTVEV